MEELVPEWGCIVSYRGVQLRSSADVVAVVVVVVVERAMSSAQCGEDWSVSE